MVHVPRWLFAVVLTCCASDARAQFGLKCYLPDFDLQAATFPRDVQDAMKATCAFGRKRLEMRDVFGKDGWSLDLFPKAQSDVTELRDLADKAADLNFKTGDPRALGNIKDIYVFLGGEERWLKETQKKYELRQQRLANLSSSASAPTAPPQADAGSTFFYVIFQDDISAGDKDAFLQAYNVTIVDGPTPNRSFRLRLGDQLSQDQLKLVLDSMNSQTKVVKSAFAL